MSRMLHSNGDHSTLHNLITVTNRSHFVQQVHPDVGPVRVPGGAHIMAHAVLLHPRFRDRQAGLCAADQYERRDVPEVS